MEAGSPGTIAARIRSWVQGSGDRRMAARAEKILVAAATVIRGTFMVQLAVTMITSAERTLHHVGFLAISTVMIVESVLMSAYMTARGAYIQSIAIFDLCFTGAAILVDRAWSTRGTSSEPGSPGGTRPRSLPRCRPRSV